MHDRLPPLFNDFSVYDSKRLASRRGRGSKFVRIDSKGDSKSLLSVVLEPDKICWKYSYKKSPRRCICPKKSASQVTDCAVDCSVKSSPSDLALSSNGLDKGTAKFQQAKNKSTQCTLEV